MPRRTRSKENGLSKTPTGIEGFEEITDGGLPKGRSCLIVGGPGSGKTLFAMEFLVNGARMFNEPGVFVSFEETEDDLIKNMHSLGFDIEELKAKGLLAIDHVKVEATEIIETGEYDLDGLFVRIDYAIRSINAKRIVLDTIEAIFSVFNNPITLRSELRRLFQFLKDRGMTAVITGEKGDGTISRNGLEEYVSDAVIVLDNRVIDNIATRRMRIIKYRGSRHGTNEYPFLINENGFSVLPISSIGLKANVSDERISSGIPDLDLMLDGKGYYRGSTILVTGQAGTGKTSLGAEFVQEACRNGKKALFITYEESPNQVIRNMRSIGIDLEPFVKSGLLKMHADRPTTYGLEMHLVTLHKMVNDLKPDVVVLDPISSLMTIGEQMEVRSTLVRMVDYLKMNGITSLFSDLKGFSNPKTGSIISSLVDTWIMLEDIEANGETNRILRVVKSRGMAHSNQIREFHISDKGIQLVPPYIGPAGVLTGSARYSQEEKEKAERQGREDEIERLKADLELEKEMVDAQITSLRSEFKKKKNDLERRLVSEKKSEQQLESGRRHLRTVRTNGKGKGAR